MPERRLAEHPFGTYALKSAAAGLRAQANRLPDGKANRLLMSLARRVLLAGREAPIDAEVFEGMRARLYPRTNRCEKRVFIGENTWDLPERQALARVMAATPAARPFVFVDGGANVGMYSLYLIGEARRLGRNIKVVAVEPDPTNLSRLRDNLAASAAREATVAPVALGAERGMARLEMSPTNRGEVRLSEAGTIEVPLMPLAEVLASAKVDHVDALKLDIEGHELPVLTAFFDTAPETVWPRLILLEVSKHGDTPAYDLCLARGYALAERTRLNALLARD